MHITALELAQVAAPILASELDNPSITLKVKMDRALHKSHLLLLASERYLEEFAGEIGTEQAPANTCRSPR